MKYLYYDHYHTPIEIVLKSKILNIDIHIKENEEPKKVIIDKLFSLYESTYFDEISIKLGENNNAYYKTKGEIIPVIGWINLKDYKNGGRVKN